MTKYINLIKNYDIRNAFKKGSYFYYASSNGLFYFSWGMFACIISVYLAGNGLSATEISLVTSAAPLFAMATQPICGMLADKMKSPKKVAIVTALLAAMSGIAFSLTKSFVWLFLFNGLTQGALNGITGLSDRMATASPYKYGTIRFWGSFLYAIAAQLSGIVYDKINPSFNYYIMAGGMILMIFTFLKMYDVTYGDVKSSKPTDMMTILKSLWANKSFRMFLLIFFLFQGPMNGTGTYLPLFIKQVGGTATTVGTTFLFSTLFEIPIVLLSDRFLKRISYRNIMMFASIMATIRFVWYSFYPSSSLIMMGFFFQGLTSIVFTLVAVRIVIDLVEVEYVNSAYGISSMLAKGLSALIFQISSGVIIDCLGPNTAYTWVFLFYALSVFSAFILSYKFEYQKKES